MIETFRLDMGRMDRMLILRLEGMRTTVEGAGGECRLSSAR
jgi:hypothetical protein